MYKLYRWLLHKYAFPYGYRDNEDGCNHSRCLSYDIMRKSISLADAFFAYEQKLGSLRTTGIVFFWEPYNHSLTEFGFWCRIRKSRYHAMATCTSEPRD